MHIRDEKRYWKEVENLQYYNSVMKQLTLDAGMDSSKCQKEH